VRKENRRLERKAISGIMLILLFIGVLTSIARFTGPVGGTTKTISGDKIAYTSQNINNIESLSSTPPATEWSRTYGGASDEMASSVVQTIDSTQ
jgi:hypothetical protein